MTKPGACLPEPSAEVDSAGAGGDGASGGDLPRKPQRLDHDRLGKSRTDPGGFEASQAQIERWGCMDGWMDGGGSTTSRERLMPWQTVLIGNGSLKPKAEILGPPSDQALEWGSMPRERKRGQRCFDVARSGIRGA